MEQNEVQSIQNLMDTARAPQSVAPGAKPLLILPANYQVAVVEHTLLNPTRKTGNAVFTRAESFIEYVNQQKDSQARLYVSNPTAMVCVLNHHAAGSLPGWGDHLAHLNMTKTTEWETWVKGNLQPKTQRDFAQFIEDNAEDISKPTGAELLDLVRTIKLSQNLECTGIITDTASGDGSYGFNLETKNKAGAKSELELPSEFFLTIAPYEGGAKGEVKVRLRIETCPPKIVLRYELVKIQNVERAALESIVEHVEAETELTGWYGEP